MEKENTMLGIRRLTMIVLPCLILPFLGLSAGAALNEVNGVSIVPKDGKVRVEISKVGEVTFNSFTMSEPARLVINCVGAKYDIPWNSKGIQGSIVSRVRTSQFAVDPVLITRIVLDLNAEIDHRMWEEGDFQIVELTPKREEGANELAQWLIGVPPIEAEKADEAEQERPDRKQVVTGAAMGPILPLVTPDDADKGADMETEKDAEQPVLIDPKPETPWVEENAAAQDPALDEVVDLVESVTPQPKTETEEVLPWVEPYMRGAPAGGGGLGLGSRKITLDAQGADIKTVLRSISEFAGINIVSGPDVEGEVFVHIKDSPWEEALDILLKAHGYGFREEYGMIRVAPVERLNREELEQQTADRKKEELLPLVTRIIFINNSDADEIRNALENVVSKRGKIDVDKGSNALVINDIERNIEKIQEMVVELDKRTYQVDINAKLVEVDVEASREFGINWGLLNLHKSGFSGTGSAEVDASIALPIGTLKFGTVRSWGELNTILEMLERSNRASIISNPRITTMDNREASILVGKEIPLIVADEAGNPITELTKIGIMLKVIPHVNADETITLDLHPEVSELQSEATAQGGVIISTSEADTRVVVRNGETAVIGGLIKKVETDVKLGIPFLKDVPYLSYLFSSTSKVEKKQELVIFVTPTVVE
jgi:type IV pilus secretin PilQ/predicted competence protein